ncbi:MAG: TrkA family potassium uptake protein [Chloroflexota bacterium]
MVKREFAVIGLGRFGQTVALTLERKGHYVLGIDENKDSVQAVASELSQAIIADSTNEEALKALDITSFETVIVAIGSKFEANIMTTVSLKQMGVKRVICKALTARQEEILFRVGADQVVHPERDSGFRLAESLNSPTMIDKFSLGEDTDYSIVEYSVPSILCNQSLGQSDLRGRFNLNVLLIKRGTDVIVNPPPDAILYTSDVVVILGHEADLQAFSELG